MGQVLQHHRAARHPGGLAHDLGRLGALDRQLGEGLVDLLGGPQLGELGVDDARVDGLGDRDEPGLAVQRHERQAAPLGGPDQRRRQRPGVAPAELDHEPGGADVVEVGDVGGQLGVVVGQRHAGREDAARRRAAGRRCRRAR